MLNDVWKTLNPKHQIPNKSKYLNSKLKIKTFMSLSLGFWYLILFSISNLAFRIYKFMLSNYYNKPRWLRGKAQAWSSLNR
jgi:hypothetical protein